MKKPISTDQPSTPAPTPSILPTEDGLVDEVGHGGEEEIVAEEPGVVNTPEGEEIVSAIIGPFDDVELIETSSTPPIFSAQPSDLPSTSQPSISPVEESVSEDDVVDEAVEETCVGNTPEEKSEGQEIVVEEQSVGENREEAEESATEEREEGVVNTPEEEQRITTPGEAGE